MAFATTFRHSPTEPVRGREVDVNFDALGVYVDGTFLPLTGGTISGNLIVTGTGTVNGQLIGKGTATNDAAAAGYIGEVIIGSLSRASATALTSATAKTITSISLTAGDWNIFASSGFVPDGAGTSSAHYCTISKTTNTLPSVNTLALPTAGEMGTLVDVTVVNMDSVFNCQSYVQLASTTTFYLVSQCTVGAGAMKGYGSIWGRRMR